MYEIIGFAIATIAGNKARIKEKDAIDRALSHIATPVNKSKFNRTGFPFDKESRRDTQFKFFGYKPKRFISVYADKPRILVKVKSKPDNSRVTNVNYNDSRTAYIDSQMAALHQQQMQMGNQQSAMAYNQGQSALQAMGYYGHAGHAMCGASSLAGMAAAGQARGY